MDDECIILLASSPMALDLAIDLLLKEVVDIFAKYAFKVNWAPGKTEAMLLY